MPKDKPTAVRFNGYPHYTPGHQAATPPLVGLWSVGDTRAFPSEVAARAFATEWSRNFPDTPPFEVVLPPSPDTEHTPPTAPAKTADKE